MGHYLGAVKKETDFPFKKRKKKKKRNKLTNYQLSKHIINKNFVVCVYIYIYIYIS